MRRQQTPIEVKLIARIQSEGPITFRDYMEAALYDRELGYYNTERLKIGPAGDYYTASNVSDVFGAVLAQFFANLFQEVASDAEETLTIVEIGAGTGQLAQDILSSFREENPDLFRRLKYTLIEKSPAMRELQAQRLAGFEEKVVSRSQGDLGAIRGIVFSNELVDAMPVHRVRLRNGQMEEQYVGVSAEPGSGPRLSLVWGQPSTSRLEEYIAKLGAPLTEGQTAEINLDAIDWLSDIAGRIERGFLITVDYGDTVGLLWSAGRRDGTLRCFHRHRLIDSPLNSPGEQDLTSSVNFTALIEYGRGFGLARAGYYRQSEFLIDKGLLERIARMDELKARLAAKNLLVPGGTSDNFRVLVQKRVNTGQAG